MADYGQSAAFNFRTNQGQNTANQIADMQYADQLKRQNEAMAAAKARLFAEDIEFQQGSNPYYSAVIQKQNQDMLAQLGEFERNNKDLYYNPEKMAQLKAMKHAYKSTPAVLGSAAYMEAVRQRNEFAKLAQKNPTAYNLDQLAEFDNKLAEYNNMRPDQPLPPPLMFRAPDEIPNFEERHRKAGGSMNPDQYQDLHIPGRKGAYIGTVSEDALTKKAQELYAQDQSAYNYVYKNMPDKIAAIKNAIRPYIKPDRKDGYDDPVGNALAIERGKQRIAAAMQRPNEDIYVSEVYNQPSFAPSDPKMLAFTFGSNPTVTYRDANGKAITESGNDFTWTSLTDKGYQGVDAKGNIKPYQKTPLKVGRGFILKPVDYGEELGVTYDDKFGPGERIKVKPEFEDSYSIWTAPDGKQYLKVQAETEVNAANKGAARRFNSYVRSTTKQREGAGAEDMITEDVSTPQIGTVQSGYEYVGGDPAQPTSWKKL